jgi:hypothetical protein
MTTTLLDELYNNITQMLEPDLHESNKLLSMITQQRARHLLFGIVRFVNLFVKAQDYPGNMHFIDFFLRDWNTYSTTLSFGQAARNHYFTQLQVVLNQFGYKHKVKQLDDDQRRMFMLCVFVMLRHLSLHPLLQQDEDETRVDPHKLAFFFLPEELADNSFDCNQIFNKDDFLNSSQVEEMQKAFKHQSAGMERHKTEELRRKIKKIVPEQAQQAKPPHVMANLQRELKRRERQKRDLEEGRKPGLETKSDVMEYVVKRKDLKNPFPKLNFHG